ncbi:MAG: hypothetical protein QOJ62_2496 [Actinomycetota bacterium]|nr:hypothetical protein [Actinomycetota bacterium]
MADQPTSARSGHPAGVFSSLDDYIGVPRIAGLAMSPDGSRLVCPVQTLSPDRTSYVTSLWEIDPDGKRRPRRLTRSAAGESAPAFTPDGDLLFVSKRPDAGKKKDDPDDVAALWSLPAAAGEPRRIAAAAGPMGGVLVARESGHVVVTASSLPGPADEDAARRKARKDAGVSALLHETTPVRHWDHDLGPDQFRLFAVEPKATIDGVAPVDGDAIDNTDLADAPDQVDMTLRDLTPTPGRGLDDAGVALSPDGSLLAVGWFVAGARGRECRSLVAVESATGRQRVLAGPRDQYGSPTAGEPGDVVHSYDQPAISPDGRFVVCVDEDQGDYDRSPSLTLWLVDLQTGEGRDLLPDFPLWPASPVFAADSASVFFVADERGRCPVFRVDVATGNVVRLTAQGAFGFLNPTPDGDSLFALWARIDQPLTPVRLAVDVADQEPTVLPAPGRLIGVPGRVEEVEATAPDGSNIRGWLVLPDGASEDAPAPLALWVHGGPLMSWNAWSWRWNPWLLAARGWAVLLPDPGLSQGYGDEFIQRAWGKWGPVPFADLMAITDATIARADIDADRTAAMGGSYGGYMANWIAGHTDRFKAIVTHASLWTTEHFTGTTDHPWAWELEWGHPLERPERFELNSPHRHLKAIKTPMLVVHGDKDYRVPLGEGLRLFADLVREGVDAKFLYFPDENHWVLKPGNAKVWYQTVFAFLDHHVLGEPWVRPELV